MKKAVLVMAVAFALWNTAPAHADASPNGCLHSDGRAAGCTDPTTPTSVPESSSFVLLASGLVALGGLALVTRKRFSRNIA